VPAVSHRRSVVAVGPRLLANLSGAILLWLLGVAPVVAQSVSGWLLDDATGAPVAGASLSLLEHDARLVAQTVTATDGHFEVSVPVPGLYRLRAQRIGYAVATSAPLDLVHSKSLTVEFRLSAVAVPLVPLTVRGREPTNARRLESWGYYDRKEIYGKEGMGCGYFLEGEELRSTAFAVSDLLREIPGMQVRSAGGRKVRVYCRLGQPLRVFYLDGVRIRLLPGETLDDYVLPTSIVAMEVYPGIVSPAEYGCCVVAVWTGFKPQE
jgi:hypothetical protein